MKSIDERLVALERENAKLRREVETLKPEDKDAALNRILRADSERLPSASAQIPTGTEVRASREEAQFVRALEEAGGNLRGGYRGFGQPEDGGYSSRHLAMVARKLDMPTMYIQQVLQNAERNLGNK